MRAWQAMLIAAVALIVCGAFFATQNLGRANAYATIASFFLALLTATGSLLSLVRSKTKAQDGIDENKLRPSPGTAVTYNASGNEHVIIGNQNSVDITKVMMESLPKQHRHRK